MARGAPCERKTFASLSEQGVAHISACEGAAKDLPDPALEPRPSRWPIGLELHDLLAQPIAPTTCKRFAATDPVELIEATDRFAAIPAELDFAAGR